MGISLNKDKCSAIDAAFKVLLSDQSNLASLNIIKETLEKCFDTLTFDVSVVDTSKIPEQCLFIMSVYPEMSTIDKITSAILANKEDEIIKKLWETNKKWTIEIDSNLLSGVYIKCEAKELTAMLLHEIGHVVHSNSLPTRISTIFRYEVTKSSFINKALIRGDKIFRTLLSLPILDSCISDNKRDKRSIKEEIKADKFVAKVGYSKELESVLTKFINWKGLKTATYEHKIKTSTDFAMNLLDNFRQRHDAIAKNNLLSIREGCCSPYMNSIIDTFIESVFEDSNTSSSLINGKKLEYMHERAEKAIENECMMEFFLFGGKQLKKIDNNEIDYAEIRIQSIKSISDKMMVVSYINSKIDLVDYYISILENPKLSKKYSIPHSIDNLYVIKKRLLLLRETALKYKIPERNNNILISWPDQYLG